MGHSCAKLSRALACMGIALIISADTPLASLRGELRSPRTVEASHHRRMQRSVERNRDDSAANSTKLLCQTAAPAVTAPKANVWGPLTDLETASILEWLFHQKELNLTTRPTGPPFGNQTLPPPPGNVSQEPPGKGSFAPPFPVSSTAQWDNTM